MKTENSTQKNTVIVSGKGSLLVANPTLTELSDTSIKKIEVPCTCSPIDKDGFISGVCDGIKITKEQIKELEIKEMKKVVAIVLHRTAGSSLDLGRAKTDKIGTHFYVDKDGTIKQVASLHKYCRHIGNIKRRSTSKNETEEDKKFYKSVGWDPKKINKYESEKEYPQRYPTNLDSVGIEVVGRFFEKTNTWEKLTEEQIISVKALHECLITIFKLNKETDTYVHEKISYKMEGEGQTVLDSIRS
jgi:hypothetical protein